MMLEVRVTNDSVENNGINAILCTNIEDEL